MPVPGVSGCGGFDGAIAALRCCRDAWATYNVCVTHLACLACRDVKKHIVVTPPVETLLQSL